MKHEFDVIAACSGLFETNLNALEMKIPQSASKGSFVCVYHTRRQV